MNIIYFIHVPWRWIKQRPHFIAEELSKENEVIVVEHMPFNKEFKSAGAQSVNLLTYFQLPKDRIPVVHFVNGLIQKLVLNKYLKKADLIWMTNPYQYSYYKKNCFRGTVVYDCMDDLPEFETTPARRALMEKMEGRLYNEADIVIASSQYLKEKLFQRYGERQVEVVNNAIKHMDRTEVTELPIEIKDKMPRGHFLITYIGTIEKWLDFDLLLRIVDDNPKVVFCLFGPLKVDIPKHEQIVYCGKVPHDLVFSVMDNSDALIMPFVLNELILSVNPVKLYEYIYSGKPCMAPRYGESLCFEEFVYLYDSSEACCDLIKELIAGKGPKHSQEESRSYALSNTWEDRVKLIDNIIRRSDK